MFSYKIDNAVIESLDHVRDLGAEIDSKLNFDLHLGKVITRAYNQRINLIFRVFVTKDPVFLKKCYLSYVRPILKYCSPVWSPHLKKDIEALERVQKYFYKEGLWFKRVRLPGKAVYPQFRISRS